MSERTDGSVVLPGVPWQELARRYEVALRTILAAASQNIVQEPFALARFVRNALAAPTRAKGDQ